MKERQKTKEIWWVGYVCTCVHTSWASVEAAAAWAAACPRSNWLAISRTESRRWNKSALAFPTTSRAALMSSSPVALVVCTSITSAATPSSSCCCFTILLRDDALISWWSNHFPKLLTNSYNPKDFTTNSNVCDDQLPVCVICVSLCSWRELESWRLANCYATGPERPWRSSTEHKTEELGIDSYPLETQTISSYRQSSWEPTKPAVSFLLLLILQLLLLILLLLFLLLLHVDFPKQYPSIKLTQNWLFLRNQKKNQTNNKAKLQQQQYKQNFKLLVYLLGKIQSTLHIQQKQTSKQTNKNQYPKTSTYQSLLLTNQEKFNPPHIHNNNNIKAKKDTKPKTSTYKFLLLLLLTYLEKFNPPCTHNHQHTRNQKKKKPNKTQNK